MPPTRSPTPCVGDWVAARTWADGRVTAEAVLPRRTAFVRATVTPGTSHGQVLATNVDLAVVVEGLHPEPDLGRIERFLALAWESGATPLVVLTKADLVPDADAAARRRRRRGTRRRRARRSAPPPATGMDAVRDARRSRAGRWRCSGRPAPASRR